MPKTGSVIAPPSGSVGRPIYRTTAEEGYESDPGGWGEWITVYELGLPKPEWVWHVEKDPYVYTTSWFSKMKSGMGLSLLPGHIYSRAYMDERSAELVSREVTPQFHSFIDEFYGGESGITDEAIIGMLIDPENVIGPQSVEWTQPAGGAETWAEAFAVPVPQNYP